MSGSSSAAILLDPRDNAAVALADLPAGAEITVENNLHRLPGKVSAKHKFACEDLAEGAPVRLYGVLVGRTTRPVAKGEALTIENLVHHADEFGVRDVRPDWRAPDVSRWKDTTFPGYHRGDGSVGTANLWIVIPMVFCENRNVDVMRQSLNRALGFDAASRYERYAADLVDGLRRGDALDDLQRLELAGAADGSPARTDEFPLVDGIRFLSHGLGCGGTRDDARALCGLLAGYATHPNVAGVTVLSLGCQNAEVSLLEEEIANRSPGFDRPFLVFEQQKHESETQLMGGAIRETLLGAVKAGEQSRAPASLDRLTIGVECGASDGFSGISANPAIGEVADLTVALGGKAVLSEFPELCGAEQDLIDRCVDRSTADKFIELMEAYARRAEAVGSALHMNPSPGNIRDGLITDAIKSAGAAKKGGTSPVVDAIDYPGIATKPGLTLLCTPGNDVESTTALAGAHCNLILFSTGLGTPTGNAVTPVIKVSSNTATTRKHPEMIDFDAGPVIDGGRTIREMGGELLDLCVEVAGGERPTRAALLDQQDFLPWKRGVSL